MSIAAACPSCSLGNHEGHDRGHGLRPGVIGGSYCDCAGDCADRFRAEGERLAEVWGFTPTPPTVAPSDLPVATGDAASEGDEHDHQWTRCGTCPHPGEPCPCSGSDCPDCPAPAHADDTDAGDGKRWVSDREYVIDNPDTDAGNEGVRLTEDEREALMYAMCAPDPDRAPVTEIQLMYLNAAVERILSARLAEVTAERIKQRDFLLRQWGRMRDQRDEARADAAEARLAEVAAERDTHREVADSMSGLWQQEKDRADRLEAMCDRLAGQADDNLARAQLAEARLGEGVVEWGVRWRGEVTEGYSEGAAKRDANLPGEKGIVVTRTVHTTPWVEVSEP